MVVETQDAYVCPWFKVVKKRVRPTDQGAEFEHYSVRQRDYVAVLAVTRTGRIPLVRQFRPAVDRHTWEFPAGLLEPGETPQEAARRELEEEAGLQAAEIIEIGSTFADTGRLSSRFHAFFAVAEEDSMPTAEPGIELHFCSIEELRAKIVANEFVLQTHVGLLYMAAIHPRVGAMLARARISELLLR